MKKIAVILCGAGFKDGSEIRESVAALWALSKHGLEAHCFALNEPQYHVINCLTGNPEPSETRNQLVESARIARGKIKPLDELNPQTYSAILLPGGFGAAKNLCTYALDGIEAKVNPMLKQKLHEFHSQKKPIGAICIAPIILALAFPREGFEITLGESLDAAADLEKLGHKPVLLSSSKAHVDSKNKIVSSPAYMDDAAPLHEIFNGIEQVVVQLKSWVTA